MPKKVKNGPISMKMDVAQELLMAFAMYCV